MQFSMLCVDNSSSQTSLSTRKSAKLTSRLSLSLDSCSLTKELLLTPRRWRLSTTHQHRPLSVVFAVFLACMATYCAKFIPNFSDVSAPLREIWRKRASNSTGLISVSSLFNESRSFSQVQKLWCTSTKTRKQSSQQTLFRLDCRQYWCKRLLVNKMGKL